MIADQAEQSSVFEGLTIQGAINTQADTLLANVQSAIRRQHPQIWPVASNNLRVALVCGGPSINDTLDELRQAIFEGAKLVTVNGSYRWCIERNLQPRAQIVLDARATNARFLDPDVPECRYYLCSHCDPATFDAVDGRPYVGIWHDTSGGDAVSTELDTYYGKRWHSIPGGTTVGTRAIALMRTLGFLRFDVFGLDSCWMGDQHHGFAQAENAADKKLRVTISPKEFPERERTFHCAPWHVKQAEDFIAFVRANGDKFLLNLHGDGMLAYMLRSLDDDLALDVTEL